MFLAEKSPRRYVGLHQKLLYKSFSLLLKPPPIQLGMRMGQGAQCYVLLKNLRTYTVVSSHLTNALSTQQLDDLWVSHPSQVTRHVLS